MFKTENNLVKYGEQPYVCARDGRERASCRFLPFSYQSYREFNKKFPIEEKMEEEIEEVVPTDYFAMLAEFVLGINYYYVLCELLDISAWKTVYCRCTKDANKQYFTRIMVASEKGILVCEGRGYHKRSLKQYISYMLVVILREYMNDEQTNYMIQIYQTEQVIENDVCKIQADTPHPMESVQGGEVQDGVKHSNTILTNSTSEVMNNVILSGDDTFKYASSENTHQFGSLTDRWMPLDTIAITTSFVSGTLVKEWHLPYDLLNAENINPSVAPFKLFRYGAISVEMRFVVNAHKFQSGKALVSIKQDPVGLEGFGDTLPTCLQREHVILDLSVNNQGTLRIPFIYHRTFLHLNKETIKNTSIRPSTYAKVQLHILANLLTGTDQSVNMNIRPYYRFYNSTFTGMEVVHSVQMNVDEIVKGVVPTKSLKAILVGAEAFIDQLGRSKNQDKPTVTSTTRIVPTARGQFASGKGLFNGSVLRLNPQVITSCAEVKQSVKTPLTTFDLARIWGLKKIMIWSTSEKPDSKLDELVIDLQHNFKRDTSRIETNFLTPLEYVSSLYGFWSGTLECRLDFVANQFHTGAIMVSIQVTKDATNDFTKASCVYTKILHLGDQRSFTFTIPYIYDTIWRRNTAQIYSPHVYEEGTTLDIDHIFSLGCDDFMRVQFYVVNELRAPETVANVVQIMLYLRAGSSFMMHSLKPSHLEVVRDLALSRDIPMFNIPTRSNLVQIAKVLEGSAKLIKQKEVEQKDMKFQMESYRAENIDDTPDFNPGSNSLRVQTLDVQINIKDIIRRPVQLTKTLTFSQDEINNNTSLFLPIMVPSHNMSNTTNSVYAEGLSLTPTAMLMNLFRFWRGSTRYTFIVSEGTTKDNIHWITHLPHSGVRKIGKISLGKGPSLVGSGLASTPIITNVNASECVEFPYDTELNWTLTHVARNSDILAVRDQTDTNAGHVIFTPSARCDVTIWWEAGDDFEYESFIGIPETVSRDRLHGVFDTEIKFQAEKSIIGKAVDSINTVMNLPSQVEHTLKTVSKVGGVISDQSRKTDELLDKGIALFDNATTLFESLSPMIASLEDKVRDVLRSVPTGIQDVAHIVNTGVEVIMDLLVAWLSRSWVVLGNILVKAIAKILGFSAIQTILSYGSQIATAIKDLVEPRIVTQAPSQSSTLLGVLCGLVGTIVGTSLDAKDYAHFLPKLLERFVSSGGVAYLNQVLRFVQSTFEVVRDLVMDALGYADPTVKALQLLSKDKGIISTFVKEANTILNEANSSLLSDPGFRKRFWYTVSQAYQIQSVLAVSPTNVVSPIVTKLCNDVIKASSEKFMDLSCSPCRYEPFVICVEGAPGIGKSFMTETMVSEMLGAIGFDRPSSGLIYTRPPGARFWSGYKNQPVVVYDDWMNLNDSDQILSQLSELYQMKSTSDFIPEMAHLEEKKIKANPLIVVLLCNGAFPSSIGQKAIYPEAIFRRRDLVLKATLKVEWFGKDLRDLTDEQSNNCEHLLFQKYSSSRNEHSLGTCKRTWTEVKPWLCATYKRYHQQETQLVHKRIKKFQNQMRLNSANYLDYSDPFSLFYTSTIDVMEDHECNPNSWLPSEQLEAAVLRVASLINEKKNDVPDLHIDVKPDNIFQALPYDWNSLSRALCSGLVLSSATIAQILDWSAQGLAYFMKPLLENICSDTKHECMTCLESTACYYVCGGIHDYNNPNAHHYMCYDCMFKMKRANLSDQCPLCRVQPMILCLPDNLSRMFILLRWVSVNVHERLMWILIYFRDGLRSQTMVNSRRFISLVSAIALLLETDTAVHSAAAMNIGNGLADLIYSSHLTLQTATSWLYGSDRDISDDEEFHTPMESCEDNNFATTQGEKVCGNNVQQIDEWDTPLECEVLYKKTLLEKPSKAKYLQINQQEVLKIQTIIPSITPVCLHHNLLKQMTYLSFAQSAEGEVYWSYVASKDNKCSWEKIPYFACHHSSCPLRDHSFVHTFVARFAEEHEIAMEVLIQQIINAPLSGKQYYINKIPFFLRGDWMQDESTTILENLIKPFTWWEYLQGKWEKYKHFFFIVSGIVGGISALSVTYTMFANLLGISGSSVPTIAQLASNDAHVRHLRGQRTVNPLNRHTTRPFVQSDTTSVVDKYIARNYVSFQIFNKENMVYQLSGVGLFNHWCLMPRHYVARLREDAQSNFVIKLVPALGRNGVRSHEATTYTFDEEDFKISPHTDAALFKVPASYPMFKDIRSFCSTDKDLSDHINSQGSIFLVPGSDGSVPRITEIDIFGRVNSAIISDDKEKFEIRDVLHYGYSQVGACGSLIRVDHHQRPIVAMHCAGSGHGTLGDGYGVLVTQEALGELMQLQVIAQCEDKEFGSLADAKMLFSEDVNVHYLGTVPMDHISHMPKKSKILPSIVHNQLSFKAHTEPAILTMQDPRYLHDQSPLYYGVIKHGKKTIDFKSSVVNKAKNALWGGWIMSMMPCVAQPKRLTYEQAVIGLPDIEYYDPMKLDTSAGYPWTIYGKTTTKSEWLDITRDHQQRMSGCVLKKPLLDEMHRKEQLRKEGTVPITLFVDTLKDERKSHAKVLKQGGTRVFCASPIDYTIATRQNFLHFSAAFMKARLNVMSAVGINAKGSEWAGLVRYLGKINNNNIVTMDYSNFGPGFNAEVARAASEIMIDWTNQHVSGVDTLELQALLKECTQSTHVCVNTVYQQTSGSPSGAAITVIINSLVNLLYILISWDQICGDIARLSNPDIYQVFRENVAVAVYGDDFIMSVSDTYKCLFNTITIQEFLSKNGIAATAMDKEKVASIPYQSLMKSEFLKRGFLPHPRREFEWLSPLSWEAVEDITQWVWKSADIREATRVNCESALLEAHGHGKEKFDQFKQDINKVLVKKRAKTLTLEWGDIDKKFYEDDVGLKRTSYMFG